MLGKIWEFLKRLFQRLLGIQPPPVLPSNPRPTRSDAEDEAVCLELLEGINTGWGRGDVAGFLIAKRVKDAELAAWLRRMETRWLATDATDRNFAPADPEVNPLENSLENPSVASLQELARRLVLLGGIRSGELGEVAGEIGRKILTQFPPPPPPEEDWRGQIIEAVFVGDGLGSRGEGNR